MFFEITENILLKVKEENMAVASESKVVSARKRRHVVVVDNENEDEVVDASEISKAKRTSCPGVRVKGNRIYDSENGKTCHQVFFFFFTDWFTRKCGKVRESILLSLNSETHWRVFFFFSSVCY